ncbi:MAG: hypothetical protein ACE5GT_13750 [Rhodospirillales bacterium]
MSKAIKTFIAMREGSGNAPQPEIVAKIFEPEPSEGESDFSCLVECPALLGTPKRIFGVDADQATELAEFFIKDIFAGKGFGIVSQDVESDSADNDQT